VVLVLAIASFAAVLTLGHHLLVGAPPLELALLSFLAPVLAGLAWTLRQQPRMLQPTVLLLLFGGTGYLLIRTAAAVFASPDSESLQASLGNTAAFAPVVYLLAVMGLSPRNARRLTIALWSALAGLVAVGLAGPLRDQLDPRVRYAIAEAFVVGHGLLVVFLGV